MARPIILRIPDGRMAFGDVPEHIDQRLQEAVLARGHPADCERLLWEAHRLGPQVLPVYYALYKFYFHRRQLDEAERVALIGLDQAARQGGYPRDWRALTPESTDWTAQGPASFTLFTLKAVAFLKLRGPDLDTARQILAKLRDLDPRDRTGHGVVAALAEQVGRESGDEE